jgi:alpha-glucosidase (family GH31 glycosyl hydrolase)
MPFLMSSAGWGIFNNTTVKNYFDVGRYDPDKLFLYTSADEIDFYLMLGDNMVDVVEQYTTLTGKPYLLPRWAYGLAFGSNILENQFNVLDNALRFRKEQIPCDIYWLEPQWMKKTYDFSTHKDWNTERFQASYEWMNDPANPKAKNLFISRMNDLGFKVVLWLCADHDLTIEEEDNLSVSSGRSSSGLEYWFQHLNKFVDQGVAGFKLDPGRTLDEHPDRNYYNGKTDAEMHNLNQVLLQKQMYGTFRAHTGMRSFHHYCGGYAGSQHWGAATVGDNGGNLKSLYDIINQSFSGNSNISIDALEDVAIKGPGIHYAFFTPWVQVNSWAWMLHPWYYNEQDKMMFRFYAQLRYSLLPYIYSSAVKSSITGQPIVWPMALAYPDDSLLTGMLQQYMFGESLLVGAFTDSIHLPEGSWIDYWTGTAYTGKQSVHCNVPENRGGPLFIKAGAIIPYQKPAQFTGVHMPDTLIVKVYPDKQSSYELLEDDGISFGYENGEIAATRFDCNESGNAIHFLIHPVDGTYKGMSGARTYLLEFYFHRKPRQVWVNNKKINNWRFDAGKLAITIQQGNRSEKQMVTIF